MPSPAAPTPLHTKLAHARSLALDILCQVMQQTETGEDGTPTPTRDARLAAATVLRLPKHLFDPSDSPANTPSSTPTVRSPSSAPAPAPSTSPPDPASLTPQPRGIPTPTSTPTPITQPLLHRPKSKPTPAATILARAGAAPATTPRAPPKAA